MNSSPLPSSQSFAGVDTEIIVEQICNQGCAAVYRVLDTIDGGGWPSVLDAVPDELVEPVVEELRSIMAVYDARDGGASCKLPSVEGD